jgi:hypothetical protein
VSPVSYAPKTEAALIRPGDASGEVNKIRPADESQGFTLPEIYEHLDTDTFEIVQLPRDVHGRLILVDENGKFKGLPRNEVATSLAVLLGNLRFGDSIVGKAIICPRHFLQ